MHVEVLAKIPIGTPVEKKLARDAAMRAALTGAGAAVRFADMRTVAPGVTSFYYTFDVPEDSDGTEMARVAALAGAADLEHEVIFR